MQIMEKSCASRPFIFCIRVFRVGCFHRVRFCPLYVVVSGVRQPRPPVRDEHRGPPDGGPGHDPDPPRHPLHPGPYPPPRTLEAPRCGMADYTWRTAPHEDDPRCWTPNDVGAQTLVTNRLASRRRGASLLVTSVLAPTSFGVQHWGSSALGSNKTPQTENSLDPP